MFTPYLNLEFELHPCYYHYRDLCTLYFHIHYFSFCTLCQISGSFYAPVSVPSGGDYVPLSLVHQYQLLRESAYDFRFGIPGSYDPMFVLRVHDF